MAREMWECEACGGTGIEEGREWDGTKCAECKGKRFVPADEGAKLPSGECPECGETLACLPSCTLDLS